VNRDAPRVSVLVPCYNKRAHVEETLQSVYDQDYDDWELIVVDDGSTDGSTELLRRHEDRARILYGENRGASAARQRALRESRGELVQYLDADDLLLPDALSTRVQALDDSGADVAYADWQRMVGEARGEVIARRMEDVDPDPEIACFTRFWSPPAALLYRRSLLERMPPWNEALPVIQDARYLQEAALAGARFVHVPGVTALYRDDAENSLSRIDALAFARDVYRNAEAIEAHWRVAGRLDARRGQAVADCYDYVARATFRRAPEIFEQCITHCDRLQPATVGRWPRVAARLQSALGHRAALAALRLMGRPAQ
jgi:glycosyltransferase involved in cell wall biosynthesis